MKLPKSMSADRSAAFRADAMKLLNLSAEQADLLLMSRMANPEQPAADAIQFRNSTDEKNEDEPDEIILHGNIGFDPFGGGGMTSAMFAQQLRNMAKRDMITVRINSPGGDVFDGLAMFNLLRNVAPAVVVQIDGLAASAASIVAMAGDEIIIPDSGAIMIHDVWGVMVGNEADARAFADLADKIDGQIAAVFAAKTNKRPATIRKMMDDETWMVGQEAVDAGFADTVVKSERVKNSFDLSQFRNVPKLLAEKGTEPDPGARLAQAVAVRARLVDLDQYGR